MRALMLYTYIRAYIRLVFDLMVAGLVWIFIFFSRTARSTNVLRDDNERMAAKTVLRALPSSGRSFALAKCFSGM